LGLPAAPIAQLAGGAPVGRRHITKARESGKHRRTWRLLFLVATEYRATGKGPPARGGKRRRHKASPCHCSGVGWLALVRQARGVRYGGFIVYYYVLLWEGKNWLVLARFRRYSTADAWCERYKSRRSARANIERSVVSVESQTRVEVGERFDSFAAAAL
jgi:hypothetical protein